MSEFLVLSIEVTSFFSQLKQVILIWNYTDPQGLWWASLWGGPGCLRPSCLICGTSAFCFKRHEVISALVHHSFFMPIAVLHLASEKLRQNLKYGVPYFSCNQFNPKNDPLQVKLEAADPGNWEISLDSRQTLRVGQWEHRANSSQTSHS